ncbi:MAG: hypothetical protein H5T46_05550, partial [Archaeoglobi archaeon]|nr:hypothetical protein [Candidatus Mnemosynella sp.]
LSNIDEQLREIEELLNRGVSGKLRLQLEGEYRKLQAMKEKMDKAVSEIDEIKRELLELTANFAPDLDLRKDSVFPYDSEHEPLSENYFRAITDIFFGEPSSHIEFSEGRISPEGVILKVPVSSDFEAFRIMNNMFMVIQEAAKKQLGLDNLMDRCWERIRSMEYAFIAFNILVEYRSLTLEEIQRICDIQDREYKKLVSQAYNEQLRRELEEMIRDKCPMIKKEGNNYVITDFGLWTWKMCSAEDEKLRAEEEKEEQVVIRSLLKRAFELRKKKR